MTPSVMASMSRSLRYAFGKSSWVKANRSSSSTGARRYEIPRARTGIRGFLWSGRSSRLRYPRQVQSGAAAPLDRLDHGLSLLVVGEDLELDGEVHLPHRDVIGDGDHGGGEVQDRSNAGRDHPIGYLLGRGSRRANHADGNVLSTADLTQAVDVLHGDRTDPLTHLALRVVHDGHDPEASRREPLVIREGMAEVARAGDQDRPVLGQAEYPSDLVDQIGHVVANPTRPIRAEIGEVLADLGRVHARRLRQVPR